VNISDPGYDRLAASYERDSELSASSAKCKKLLD
jgi:hypothetical protein